MQLTLREIPAFPPPWAYASTGQAEERRGRVAARRALVDLKLCFMRAAADVPGPRGEQLQQAVRQAGEPIELWLLQSALLAALPEDCERGPGHGRAMQQALNRVGPELLG